MKPLNNLQSCVDKKKVLSANMEEKVKCYLKINLNI